MWLSYWVQQIISIISSVCSCVLGQTSSVNQCCHTSAWGSQIRTFVRSGAEASSHLKTSLRCQLAELSPRGSIWQSLRCPGQRHCRAFSRETLVPPHSESIFPLFFCFRGDSSHLQLASSFHSKHSGPSEDHLSWRELSGAEVDLQCWWAESWQRRTESSGERVSVEQI